MQTQGPAAQVLFTPGHRRNSGGLVLLCELVEAVDVDANLVDITICGDDDLLLQDPDVSVFRRCSSGNGQGKTTGENTNDKASQN